jgi:hypothetical protein
VVAPTSASSHHQHLGISSQQGLELTITETAADAAGLLADALQSIPAVFEEPGTLGNALRAAAGAASHLSAAWWLDNQTGAAVEVWLATPGEAASMQHLTGSAQRSRQFVWAVKLGNSAA